MKAIRLMRDGDFVQATQIVYQTQAKYQSDDPELATHG
jgi:hypothetical protein